jgi:lysophospholipase L1-like esterase
MPASKTFLALGDSYTIGESVSEKDCWPFKLVELFNKSGNPFNQPVILAKTGWTTDELLLELTKHSFPHQFDLVSLLIGVNNQYRDYSEITFATEFELLLRQAIQFAGNRPKRVVVLSIPDWGVTPFAEGKDRLKIAARIDVFNNICLEISKSTGVSFIDITEISRRALTDLTLIAQDGLHPSPEMYSLWSELVFEKLCD